jgi:hypothetical protein
MNSPWWENDSWYKTLRSFEPEQILLLPPSLNEWLPEDHLARFVAELVDGVLDLSAIYADYTEARASPGLPVGREVPSPPPRRTRAGCFCKACARPARWVW